MQIGNFFKRFARKPARPRSRSNRQATPTSIARQDFRFTRNFAARAKEWGLSEEHARLVYYEGDTVKANMKVLTYKGEEIGIYVFHDRETNVPVVTSIWKRRRRT